MTGGIEPTRASRHARPAAAPEASAGPAADEGRQLTRRELRERAAAKAGPAPVPAPVPVPQLDQVSAPQSRLAGAGVPRTRHGRPAQVPAGTADAGGAPPAVPRSRHAQRGTPPAAALETEEVGSGLGGATRGEPAAASTRSPAQRPAASDAPYAPVAAPVVDVPFVADLATPQAGPAPGSQAGPAASELAAPLTRAQRRALAARMTAGTGGTAGTGVAAAAGTGPETPAGAVPSAGVAPTRASEPSQAQQPSPAPRPATVTGSSSAARHQAGEPARAPEVVPEAGTLSAPRPATGALEVPGPTRRSRRDRPAAPSGMIPIVPPPQTGAIRAVDDTGRLTPVRPISDQDRVPRLPETGSAPATQVPPQRRPAQGGSGLVPDRQPGTGVGPAGLDAAASRPRSRPSYVIPDYAPDSIADVDLDHPAPKSPSLGIAAPPPARLRPPVRGEIVDGATGAVRPIGNEQVATPFPTMAPMQGRRSMPLPAPPTPVRDPEAAPSETAPQAPASSDPALSSPALSSPALSSPVVPDPAVPTPAVPTPAVLAPVDRAPVARPVATDSLASLAAEPINHAPITRAPIDPTASTVAPTGAQAPETEAAGREPLAVELSAERLAPVVAAAGLAPAAHQVLAAQPAPDAAPVYADDVVADDDLDDDDLDDEPKSLRLLHYLVLVAIAVVLGLVIWKFGFEHADASEKALGGLGTLAGDRGSGTTT